MALVKSCCQKGEKNLRNTVSGAAEPYCTMFIVTFDGYLYFHKGQKRTCTFLQVLRYVREHKYKIK
jgi:hypothetical protein